MRYRNCLAALVLICACGVSQATVHGHPPVKTAPPSQAAVEHLENQWLDAINHADVDAIAPILADDFVRPAPQSGQFVGKADLLRYYRSHLVPLKEGSKRIENMTVTVYDQTAMARGQVVTRDAKGAIVSTLLFTDVFVRRAGKWQAVSAQENPLPGH